MISFFPRKGRGFLWTSIDRTIGAPIGREIEHFHPGKLVLIKA